MPPRYRRPGSEVARTLYRRLYALDQLARPHLREISTEEKIQYLKGERFIREEKVGGRPVVKMTALGHLALIESRGSDKKWDQLSASEQQAWARRLVELSIQCMRERPGHKRYGISLQKGPIPVMGKMRFPLLNVEEFLDTRIRGLQSMAEYLSGFYPTSPRLQQKRIDLTVRKINKLRGIFVEVHSLVESGDFKLG